MKRKPLLYVLLPLSVCLSTSFGQERGQWRAVSTTARSITGDLAFGGEKVSINFNPFTIAQIRAITPTEITALFHIEADTSGGGNLYRVVVPASKKFLHHNTLCGEEETDWIITYVTGPTLQLAMFSDPKIPELTPEALANGTRLCGTYTYTR